MDCMQVPKYFLAWMSSGEISGNGCTLPRNSPTHEPQKSRNVPCGDWEFVGIKETRCNVLIIGFWRCRLDRAKLAVPNRVTPPTSVCSRASCQNVRWKSLAFLSLNVWTRWQLLPLFEWRGHAKKRRQRQLDSLLVRHFSAAQLGNLFFADFPSCSDFGIHVHFPRWNWENGRRQRKKRKEVQL